MEAVIERDEKFHENSLGFPASSFKLKADKDTSGARRMCADKSAGGYAKYRQLHGTDQYVYEKIVMQLPHKLKPT